MAITRIGNPALANVREPNFRNIIINGGMDLAQRSTSVSSITGDGYYTVDRFDIDLNTLGTWTQSQSTDVPTGQGFAKSLKMDCTTADGSPAAGDKLIFEQVIEGQNLQYLKKGTSSAESLTLSFWVKTNKTGTYTLELLDNDNSRSFSQTYTVSSANTWEKKTITYAGDTTGAFDNDNGNSFQCNFWLGAGSNFTSGTFQNSWGSKIAANRVSSSQVNLADSTSNEWYITGVQLEAGTASDFEFLPFDVNLERCQRYYYVQAEGSQNAYSKIELATAYTTTTAYAIINFKQTMRAAPSLDIVAGTSFYRFRSAGINNTNTATPTIANATTINCRISLTTTSLTAGYSGWMAINNQATGFVAFDAELS